MIQCCKCNLQYKETKQSEPPLRAFPYSQIKCSAYKSTGLTVSTQQTMLQVSQSEGANSIDGHAF